MVTGGKRHTDLLHAASPSLCSKSAQPVRAKFSCHLNSVHLICYNLTYILYRMTTVSRIWKQLFLRKTCTWQEIQFVLYKGNKAKNLVVVCSRGTVPWLVAFKKVHFIVSFFIYLSFLVSIVHFISLEPFLVEEKGASVWTWTTIPTFQLQKDFLVVDGKPLRKAATCDLLFWVSMKTLKAEKTPATTLCLKTKAFFLHFFFFVGFLQLQRRRGIKACWFHPLGHHIGSQVLEMSRAPPWVLNCFCINNQFTSQASVCRPLGWSGSCRHRRERSPKEQLVRPHLRLSRPSFTEFSPWSTWSWSLASGIGKLVWSTFPPPGPTLLSPGPGRCLCTAWGCDPRWATPRTWWCGKCRWRTPGQTCQWPGQPKRKVPWS